MNKPKNEKLRTIKELLKSKHLDTLESIAFDYVLQHQLVGLLIIPVLIICLIPYISIRTILYIIGK